MQQNAQIHHALHNLYVRLVQTVLNEIKKKKKPEIISQHTVQKKKKQESFGDEHYLNNSKCSQISHGKCGVLSGVLVILYAGVLHRRLCFI